MVDVKVTSNPKPKSMWKTVLGVLIVLGLIAAAVCYYAWPKGEGDDSPPVLGPSAEDQLQGLTALEGKLMKFDGKKFSHVCEKGKYMDVPVGVTYLYSDKEVSFQDVIKAVKSGNGTGLIAYYNILGNSPYKASNDKTGMNFYVYPNPWGASTASSVPEDKLDDYEIPPYFTFMILVDKNPIQVCKDKFRGWTDEIDLEDDQTAEEFLSDWSEGVPDDGLAAAGGSPVGWMLLPFGQDDLMESFVDGAEDSIEAVWPQYNVNAAVTADKGDSDFVKLDVDKFVEGLQELGEYQMVWIKFMEPEDEEPAVDVDYLDVIGASAVDATHIKVTFDEDVDAATLEVEDFTLEYSGEKGVVPQTDMPDWEITSVEIVAADSKSVLLTLKSEPALTMLGPGELALYYKVTVSGVGSAEGEALNPDSAKTFAVFQYTEEVAAALTCALGKDNPAASTISADGSSVEFLDFSCTSTSTEIIILKELTFEKMGSGDVSDFRVLSSEIKVGEGEFAADGKATVTLSNVAVHPGKSVDLAVWWTVNKDAIVGDTYGVTLTGVVPAVGGLPLKGSVMTVVAAEVADDKLVVTGAAKVNSFRFGVDFDEAVDESTVKMGGGWFDVSLSVVDAEDKKVAGVEYVVTIVSAEADKVVVSVDKSIDTLPVGQKYKVTVGTVNDQFKGADGSVLEPNPSFAYFTVDAAVPGDVVGKTLKVTVAAPTEAEGFIEKPANTDPDILMTKLTFEATGGNVKLSGLKFLDESGSIDSWGAIDFYSPTSDDLLYSFNSTVGGVVEGLNHTFFDNAAVSFYIKLDFGGGVNGDSHKLCVDGVTLDSAEKDVSVVLEGSCGGEITFK